jgi:cytochrome c-type protein NapB
MKLINKASIVIAFFAILSVGGCSGGSTAQNNGVVGDSVSEESLGLRKTNLYVEEAETHGAKTSYGESSVGSGYKIDRAFQDAPPMIPHSVDGLIPVTRDNNSCVGCHMPDVAPSVGATAVPVSHLTNFRPTHKFDGKMFKKSIDNMKNEVSIKETGGKLYAGRFNCTQCHAPQSTGALAVENTFEATYTKADGASKSTWNKDKYLDSLDTIIGGPSVVTDEDLANKNSAAGHMEH